MLESSKSTNIRLASPSSSSLFSAAALISSRAGDNTWFFSDIISRIVLVSAAMCRSCLSFASSTVNPAIDPSAKINTRSSARVLLPKPLEEEEEEDFFVFFSSPPGGDTLMVFIETRGESITNARGIVIKKQKRDYCFCGFCVLSAEGRLLEDRRVAWGSSS